MRICRAAWVVIGLGLSGLAGCASVYDVTPMVAQSKHASVEASNDALLIKHKNQVSVVPVKFRINQFETPRFMVTVKNLGNKPFELSTKNIEVTFNGQPAHVLSYEEQLQDIDRRLSYYGYQAPVKISLGTGQGLGLGVSFDQSMDSVDVQEALADLKHLQQTGLRDKVLQPGDQYSAEVVLGNKLAGKEAQKLLLNVNLEGEQYRFAFDYTVRH